MSHFSFIAVYNSGNPGPLNDLWKYSPGTQTWTYVPFPSTPGDSYFQNGGSLGRDVFPGDRYCMIDRWKTNSGNDPLLFGGSRLASMNSLNLLFHPHHYLRQIMC